MGDRQLIAQPVVEGQGHQIATSASSERVEVLVEGHEREASLQKAKDVDQLLGFFFQYKVCGENEARAVAARQAIRDAGRMQNALQGGPNGHRVGVSLGSTSGSPLRFSGLCAE